MKSTFRLLGMLSVLLASCRLATPATPTPAPTPFPQPALPRLSLAALQNAEYHSPDWGDFRLEDGIYYRPPSAPGESPEIYVTQIVAPAVYGDLNGDGLDDAAVILSTQNGGTGHFRELAAVINRDGRADNVATVSLGDRVGVEAARIMDGMIVLEMRAHGPHDGLCCPSQFVTWRFLLVNGRLMQLP